MAAIRNISDNMPTAHESDNLTSPHEKGDKVSNVIVSALSCL